MLTFEVSFSKLENLNTRFVIGLSQVCHAFGCHCHNEMGECQTYCPHLQVASHHNGTNYTCI